MSERYGRESRIPSFGTVQEMQKYVSMQLGKKFILCKLEGEWEVDYISTEMFEMSANLIPRDSVSSESLVCNVDPLVKIYQYAVERGTVDGPILNVICNNGLAGKSFENLLVLTQEIKDDEFYTETFRKLLEGVSLNERERGLIKRIDDATQYNLFFK